MDYKDAEMPMSLREALNINRLVKRKITRTLASVINDERDRRFIRCLANVLGGDANEIVDAWSLDGHACRFEMRYYEVAQKFFKNLQETLKENNINSECLRYLDEHDFPSDIPTSKFEISGKGLEWLDGKLMNHFKKAYYEKYQSSWLSNPWSSMKRKLEAGDISFGEIFSYSIHNPNSRTAKVIHEMSDTQSIKLNNN